MSSYLDILSGTIIGGMVMLIALTASDLGLRRMYNHNADEILQSNLKRITQVIEFDLRKMGFGVPDDELPNIIQIKDPDRLKFLVQLNMDTGSRHNHYRGAGGHIRIPDSKRHNHNRRRFQRGFIRSCPAGKI